VYGRAGHEDRVGRVGFVEWVCVGGVGCVRCDAWAGCGGELCVGFWGLCVEFLRAVC
jgi:hypothetical protein